MGDVVGLIRIMPTEVLEDDKLYNLMEEIKAFVKPPAKIGNIEIKNIAFGLKAINLTVVIPDSAGQG
jgi:translation elongation factor aEF-1 beta